MSDAVGTALVFFSEKALRECALEDLYEAGIVLLVLEDRTEIVKNRYGKAGIVTGNGASTLHKYRDSITPSEG